MVGEEPPPTGPAGATGVSRPVEGSYAHLNEAGGLSSPA
jgi:hypothetical protein